MIQKKPIIPLSRMTLTHKILGIRLRIKHKILIVQVKKLKIQHINKRIIKLSKKVIIHQANRHNTKTIQSQLHLKINLILIIIRLTRT